jgi:hypothetical protein
MRHCGYQTSNSRRLLYLAGIKDATRENYVMKQRSRRKPFIATFLCFLFLAGSVAVTFVRMKVTNPGIASVPATMIIQMGPDTEVAAFKKRQAALGPEHLGERAELNKNLRGKPRGICGTVTRESPTRYGA